MFVQTNVAIYLENYYYDFDAVFTDNFSFDWWGHCSKVYFVQNPNYRSDLDAVFSNGLVNFPLYRYFMCKEHDIIKKGLQRRYLPAPY